MGNLQFYRKKSIRFHCKVSKLLKTVQMNLKCREFLKINDFKVLNAQRHFVHKWVKRLQRMYSASCDSLGVWVVRKQRLFQQNKMFIISFNKMVSIHFVQTAPVYGQPNWAIASQIHSLNEYHIKSKMIYKFSCVC